MKVRELMTRDVGSCSVDDGLHRAAQILWERDCGIVPVVDGESRVIGVITDRDVCMAAYTKGAPLACLRVGDAMATRVSTCAPGDEIETALALMRERQVRRLPVVAEGGVLLGILSIADLVRGAARAQVASTLAAICRPHAALEPAAPLPSAVLTPAARTEAAESRGPRSRRSR